jgi:hypothetical protein
MKFTQKNLSCRNKIISFFDTFVFIVVVLWVSTYFIFPFYTKSFHYDNYKIYVNDESIKKTQIDIIFKRAMFTLKKNFLYHSKNSVNIYVVDNPIVYAILDPLEVVDWWNSYAVATIGNLVVIKKGDFATNKVYDKTFSENFDAVLVHELTHTLQFDHYGYISTGYTTPKWVLEGYATYSEKELSINSIEQLYKKSFLQLKGSKLHASLDYQFWALMVKHAIEKMHKSVDDLHLGKVDYDEVLDSMLQEYNISKTPSP